MGWHYFSNGLIVVLACLLIAAAVTDLKSRIISNRLNLAVALLAPLFWVAQGLAFWPDMAIQVALGFAVFAAFTGLFALGVMGGGDVKLLAGLALWLPWQPLLFLIVLMSLIGGAVTIITIVHHRLSRRIGQPEIPYGVAISLAALWVIGEPYLNQFTG
jgi:prepilin peptidase CpaA